MNKILLSIIVCFVLTTPTNVYSFTGEQWIKLCGNKNINKSKDSIVTNMVCMSYIRGLREMEVNLRSSIIALLGAVEEQKLFDIKDSMREMKSKFFENLKNVRKNCVPPQSSNEQLMKIMIKSINENPDKLHFPMSMLYVDIMLETFPCNT